MLLKKLQQINYPIEKTKYKIKHLTNDSLSVHI